jgi:hypothetical protein
MNLFDQLKVQAHEALEEKHHIVALSAEAILQRNNKLKEIFDYWHEFSELIKVIEPDYEHSISLPRRQHDGLNSG